MNLIRIMLTSIFLIKFAEGACLKSYKFEAGELNRYSWNELRIMSKFHFIIFLFQSQKGEVVEIYGKAFGRETGCKAETTAADTTATATIAADTTA